MDDQQRHSNEYYDCLVDKYRKISKNRQEYLSGIDQLLIEIIKEKKVRTILDVGTGDGIRLESIRRKISPNISITAIEPSQKMFRAARQNLSVDVDLLECDLCAVEETKKFHLISALWNVIGHVDDLAAFFKKVSSVIDESNGVFVFDANNIFNVRQYGISSFFKNKITALLGKNIYKYNLKTADAAGYVKLYHLRYIEQLLKLSGFNTVRVAYIDYATGEQTYKYFGQIFFISER